MHDKKHGYGIYHINDENKSIIGKFIDNAIHGLALQYKENEIEKYMYMDNNKVIKTLNTEEINKMQTSEEFFRLKNFKDEVSIRINNINI